MPSLFCYGTLQVPAVMQAVTGRVHNGVPAHLPGYARFCVKDADYPGIVPSKTDETDGILYDDISAPELAVLDRFEGEHYTRRITRVLLEDGSRTKAWTYVITEGQEDRLTDQPWRLDRFLESGLSRFMRTYVEDRRKDYAQ
jgi:gamma-glutamylcyclotransferase (GGCT)/AIG2-like uncharacterized protein YtfP